MLSCQVCLENSPLCGYADEGGKGLGPTAALIGQAAGSSVSSTKWRHVRPVRLQLGPDCFPEALEAASSLPLGPPWREKGAPHGVWTWPQLAWEGLFLVWAHAGKECYTQTGMHTQTLSREHKSNTDWRTLSCKPVHSCVEFALTGLSVFSFAYNHQVNLRRVLLWSWCFRLKSYQSCKSSLFLDNNKKMRSQGHFREQNPITSSITPLSC